MVNTQLVNHREREQSSIVTQTNNQLNVALSQLQSWKWLRIVTQTNSHDHNAVPRGYPEERHPQPVLILVVIAICVAFDVHVVSISLAPRSLSVDTSLSLY